VTARTPHEANSRATEGERAAIYSPEWHEARAADLEAGNTDGLTIMEAARIIAMHRMAARAIKGENQ
jgi:hypothetical protein